MNWKSVPLTLSLALTALCGLPGQSQAQKSLGISTTKSIHFEAPGEDAPYSTAGGASRGTGICMARQERLTALTPIREIGLTTAHHPTLLVYVPSSSAKSLELIVAQEDGTEVVRKSLPLPINPGVVSLKLTDADMPPLAVGKPYQWYVSLICDDLDRSANPVVEGWVKRIEADTTLSHKLEQEALVSHPGLYAEAGLWQETLVTLFDLRLAQPNNSVLAANWQQLLQSVGLESIATAPLSDRH